MNVRCLPGSEEGDHFRNSRPNRLSKLGYKYISITEVRKYDILPSSESFDNVFAIALRLYDFDLSRDASLAIRFGMAGPIDFRNSATSTSVSLRSENMISYHHQRVSTMHLHQPNDHSHYS